MDQLERDWDKRPPAKITLDMLREKEKEICALKERDQQFALKTQGMGGKLEAIKTSLEEHKTQQKEDFDKLTGKIDKFIESADTKFAPILVYRILVWAGGIAGAAAIVGFLGLIVRLIINLNN
jgi:hypothetical protein